mgnify:CR=1 FL=1
MAGCSSGGVRYGAQRSAADLQMEARFHAADTDKDELLSLEEARAGMPELVDLFATIDTDGSGTIGWIKYTTATHELLNTSAELDEPVAFLGLIDSYLPRMTDQGKARWSGPDALKRHLLLQCTAYWKTQGGVDELASLGQLEAQVGQLDFAGRQKTFAAVLLL